MSNAIDRNQFAVGRSVRHTDIKNGGSDAGIEHFTTFIAGFAWATVIWLSAGAIMGVQ